VADRNPPGVAPASPHIPATSSEGSVRHAQSCHERDNAWTLPGGQSVVSLWNGNATYSGQDVMVHNADWNGALDPGKSATFGYVVSGSGGDPATELPCQVG
jgi:hypothetical protein